MIVKYYLSELSDEVVNIRKQKYVMDEGKNIPVGLPERMCLGNNAFGRNQVRERGPENYQRAIFTLWGENEPEEPAVVPEI